VGSASRIGRTAIVNPAPGLTSIDLITLFPGYRSVKRNDPAG
jgi:hypothetical protein